jgi:Tfp pilus assembly protein PilV
MFGLAALVAFVLVVFGVLLGCTLSEWQLKTRARRQAAMQRSLNRQWQELQVARQTLLR